MLSLTTAVWAAHTLTPLGGSVVSPTPAFPIRPVGRPITPAPLKSRSPHSELAASPARRPLEHAVPIRPAAAGLGQTATKAPVRGGAPTPAARTALRRTPALRPKARH